MGEQQVKSWAMGAVCFLAACQTPDATGLPDTANFDAFERALSDAKQTGVGQRLVGVAWSYDYLTGAWTILGFGRDSAGGWVAKRTVGGQEMAAVVDWTSETRCASLPRVLERIEALPPPAVDVPGLGASDSDSISMMDGGQFGIHLRLPTPASGPRYETLDLTSNILTPLQLWFDTSSAALQDCWTAESPQPD